MKTRYVLAIIFVIGLALRIVTLDAHSLWGDEVYSLEGAALGPSVFFSDRFGFVADQTPLYYLVVWLSSGIADPATTAFFVRLPAAIAGGLTILVVYELGKEMFGEVQGLIAGLFIAVSPRMLDYSQDLRLYSIMVLLTTVTLLSLLRAKRTNQLRWWAAFVAGFVLNILFGYIALSMATPPLLILLTLVLWEKWQYRKEDSESFRAAIIATAVILISVALVAIDLLGIPRAAANLEQLSFEAPVRFLLYMLPWLTPFGFSLTLETILQGLIQLLAVLGLIAAFAHTVRAKRRTFSGITGIVYGTVPFIALAVFVTTRIVFERYVLFILPVYFLLIGHGIVTLYEGSTGLINKQTMAGQISRVLGAALFAVILMGFTFGIYTYMVPETHEKLAYRPDGRGVATSLAEHVSADDTIIFIDAPVLGYTVANYYWHNNPPCPAYSAQDPRVFAQKIRGDIFWVVNGEDLDVLRGMPEQDPNITKEVELDNLAVFRQTNATSLIAAMDRITDQLESAAPITQFTKTLRGGIQQEQGNLQQASESYMAAGTYLPLGDDYLRTAIGYDRIGLTGLAWQEALFSKSWQPYRSEIHGWLAQKLQQEGFIEQSQAEKELARLLTGELKTHPSP